MRIPIRSPRREAGVLILIGLMSCGAPEPAQHAAEGDGTTVSLLDFHTSVPSNWEQSPPSNPMRLAEFQTPASAEGEEATVVVYYFGEGQGGSADANIARWSSQFTSPEGGPVEPEVERFEVGGLATTVAEFHGSYARGVGMGMGSGEPEPDQAMISAVVETPQGNLFFQIFGPEESVTGQKEAFLEVVQGLEPGSAEESH